MAASAELLLPTGPPSAADWAAVIIAAASETTVTTATIVAVATIAVAVAVTNNNDHLCDGHTEGDRLCEGYDDVIINNGSPSFLFLSNNNKIPPTANRLVPWNIFIIFCVVTLLQ